MQTALGCRLVELTGGPFVLREYCKELKVSLNHTQFLLDFGLYIDRNTPNACESMSTVA